MNSRWIFAVTSLALAACATMPKDPDLGLVQRKWTQGVQRLGLSLTPVYPPSEDYQVGDVYALGQLKATLQLPDGLKDVVPRTLRIGTKDPKDALSRAYGKRLLFPSSPYVTQQGKDSKLVALDAQGNGVLDRTAAPAPAAGGTFAARGKSAPLPIVAFPAFMIASGSLNEFGGSFGAGAYATLFGGGSAANTALSITIDDGETYGLDAVDASAELDSFCRAGTVDCTSLVALMNRAIGPRLHEVDKEPFSDATALYVSRVYMTRKITYNYAFNSAQAFNAAAAAASAKLEAARSSTNDLKGLLSTPAPAQPGQAADQANPNAQRDQLAINLLDNINKNLQALSGTGGNASYLLSMSYATQTITLSQTFLRPVVFAYVGIQWSQHGALDNPGPADALGPALNPLQPSKKVMQ